MSNQQVIRAFLNGQRGRNTRGSLVSEARLLCSVLSSHGEVLAVAGIGGHAVVRITDAALRPAQTAHLSLLLSEARAASRTTWPDGQTHLRALAQGSGLAAARGSIPVDAVILLCALGFLVCFWTAVGLLVRSAVV